MTFLMHFSGILTLLQIDENRQEYVYYTIWYDVCYVCSFFSHTRQIADLHLKMIDRINMKIRKIITFCNFVNSIKEHSQLQCTTSCNFSSSATNLCNLAIILIMINVHIMIGLHLMNRVVIFCFSEKRFNSLAQFL